ncbi:OstA-like protein [Elysia marginata]|uniref:OstA-like protein n=1 Tax=Elysia marginata TaxID=1093978 RepID=A0AAV4FN73_9GAST|nr:OstA-like protein [Elysia marginata]
MAISRENVLLESNEASLTTDTLYFDRTKQEAFFNTYGKIVSGENTLTSNKGRYFFEKEKFQFLDNVELINKDAKINSVLMDYHPKPKDVYYHGPTTIIGKDYIAYGERGFYQTIGKTGYMIKNARIDYRTRIIFGDSIFFDENKEYATITNNIRVLDTLNNIATQGHYGELYKKKDSIFLIKRAVAIFLLQKDSLYIHGDRILITGKKKERIIRAYNNVKIYRKGMSGKCDSIHFDEKTGIIQMIKNPVLWYGKNQITGDSIHLVLNKTTKKMDSLKVMRNAFMVEKDTLGTGYNQTMGKDIYGLFKDGEIYQIDVKKNSEAIYYLYDEASKLIGINKTISNDIKVDLVDKKLEQITFLIKPKGNIFPEKDLPENARKLKNFNWRGEEMIYSKEGIFDEDDRNITLPKIEGID